MSGKTLEDDPFIEAEAEEVDLFDGAQESNKTTLWGTGGAERDKIIQKMLKYANEFGVHYSNEKDPALDNVFVRGNDCLIYLKKFTEYVVN